MPLTEPVALVGLFLSAFVAATVLPAQSEAVLVALLLSGETSPVLLVAVASLGNIGGALVNWTLGRFADRLAGRGLATEGAAMRRARAWYHRWGRWSLLFSWVPIVGDPLTVVAGVMREPLASFLPLVAVGKIARYTVLAALTLGWAGA